MALKSYTQESPPKRGKALKIWASLNEMGFDVKELHYNPNCWGNSPDRGWGTWAFTEIDPPDLQSDGFWCGEDAHGFYVQGMSAPYHKVYQTLDKVI